MTRWLLPIMLLISCGSNIKEEKRYLNPTGPYKGVVFYAAGSEFAQGKVCDDWLIAERQSNNVFSAMLWGSFGRNYNCLYRFFHTFVGNVPTAFEIYFSNEVCRKYGRCNQYDFFPNDSVDEYNHRLEIMSPETINAIYWRLTEIRFFMAPYEDGVDWILAIQLEGDLSEKAQQNILSVIREVWPYKLAVYGPAPDGVYSELHNVDSPAGGILCIQNNDGRDIGIFPGSGVKLFGQPPLTMSQIMDYVEGSERENCYTGLWFASMQGVDGSPFIPTLERDRLYLDAPQQVGELIKDYP